MGLHDRGPSGAAPEWTRRQFLRAAGLLSVAGVAAGVSGCSQPPSQAAPGVGGDRSAREPYLRFVLYPDYIDGAPDGPFVTLDRFRAESGMDVSLSLDLTDPAAYMDAMQKRFEVGLPTSADLVIMPDSLIARFAREGWLQRFVKSEMATVYSSMNPALFAAPADKARQRSIPWVGGATGIAYDSAVVGPVTGYRQLLDDPALRGRAGLFSSLDSSLPALTCAYGTTPSELTPKGVDATITAVGDAAARGQFAAQYGDIGYLDDFRSGRVAAGLAFSGDVLRLGADMPSLRFVVPTEGGQLWLNSLVVPKGAPHRVNAEELLTFYYEPGNAAELAAWLKGICPVPAAQEAMRDIAPELADSPFVFPTRRDLANLTMARIIRAAERVKWTIDWNNALARGGTDGA